jgi:hypothetical protein
VEAAALEAKALLAGAQGAEVLAAHKTQTTAHRITAHHSAQTVRWLAVPDCVGVHSRCLNNHGGHQRCGMWGFAARSGSSPDRQPVTLWLTSAVLGTSSPYRPITTRPAAECQTCAQDTFLSSHHSCRPTAADSRRLAGAETGLHRPAEADRSAHTGCPAVL